MRLLALRLPRERRLPRRWVVRAVVTGVLLVALGLTPWAVVQLSTSSARHSDRAADAVIGRAPVAVVLGAGLAQDGTPSPFLAERVAVAADLYSRGLVKALLMSGDNSRPGYDEVTAMSQAAQQRGVPASAIVLDYAGFDTYSSCYRAVHVFGVQHAVVVSQPFHLARAVWLCRSLGVQTVGVATGADAVPETSRGILREIPADAKAVVDVLRGRLPTFAGPPEHSLDWAA